MQYLKFYGLLFLVEKKENGWGLIIDGPESILDSTRSYGVNFSNLFPALLLIEGGLHPREIAKLSFKN